MRFNSFARILGFTMVSYCLLAEWRLEAVEFEQILAPNGVNGEIKVETRTKKADPPSNDTMPAELKARGGQYYTGDMIVEQTLVRVPQLNFEWTMERSIPKGVGFTPGTGNQPLALYVSDDQSVVVVVARSAQEVKLIAFQRHENKWKQRLDTVVWKNDVNAGRLNKIRFYRISRRYRSC